MKRFWKKLITEIRIALLRREYLKADAYERRLFDAYDCGADLIDVLTGGEMADPNIIIYAKGYKAAGGNPDDIGLFCDGQSLA